MSRRRRRAWTATMIGAGLALGACGGEAGNETPEAQAAAPDEQPAAVRDACTLIRAEEVSAIVGEPVVAQPDSRGSTESSCVYQNPDSKMEWLALTVTWRGGREYWDIMNAGTEMAIGLMEGQFGDEDGVIDSIIRPGPVGGLGDKARFSDLMPSTILDGDILIEMLVTFLPDPELQFVPLGRKVLERL